MGQLGQWGGGGGGGGGGRRSIWRISEGEGLKGEVAGERGEGGIGSWGRGGDK